MDRSRLTRLRLNDRTVDLQRGLVTDAAGQAMTLRPQAAEVLRLLAAQPGVLVTKDQLMRAVWRGIAVTDDSLVQCVTEIRKALGDKSRQIIVTLAKRGYVFEAGPGVQLDALNGTVAAPAASIAPSIAGRGPVTEPLPSIAVLPFDDMSADRSLTYMGDGVAEDIIAMLARSPDVIVIARNSSFAHKGEAADIRNIGRELGVEYVLEGSVRMEASELRIVAQLNDAKTGQHLWAERFDRAGSDPWALQDEVTGRIIASLTGEVGQLRQAQYREAWGKDTTALGEYDYYLRGHDVFMKAEKKEEHERAGRIWRAGLSKFPRSKLLRICLGWYHFFAAWSFRSDDLAADFRKAGELVREDLAEDHLTPKVRRLGHWLFAFVLIREGDFERAVQEANTVVEMAPYDAFALVDMAEVMTVSGLYDQALDWLTIGEARDPTRAARYHRDRAYVYRLMGRYEESVREYRCAGFLRPWFRLSLAIDYVRLGRLQEAKAAVKEALKVDPTFTLEIWRQGCHHRDPAIPEAEIFDLATAGLPER